MINTTNYSHSRGIFGTMKISFMTRIIRVNKPRLLGLYISRVLCRRGRFGELSVSVNASIKGEVSDGEEGPKIKRSLIAEGVRGRTTSSFSGKAQSGDGGGGGFFLGLTYESRGSSME